MSKKNRDLQLTLEDTKVVFNGKNYQGTTVVYGKKNIATIIENDSGMFEGFLNDDESKTYKAKTFNECLEIIIKEWNLHHT